MKRALTALLTSLLMSATSAQAADAPKPSEAKDLIALIRPTATLSQVAAAMGSQESSSAFVVKPLAGDLSQVLVLDRSRAYQYLNSQDLAALGLSEDQAWARAWGNLTKRFGKVEIVPVNAEGVQGVTSSNGLGNSLLVNFSLCSATATKDMGGVLVQVVGDQAFLFAPVKDGRASASLWSIISSHDGDKDAYSHTPLLCKDGIWSVAKAP